MARAPRGGFTLVEASFATLLVGGMLVAALSTVGGSAQARLRQFDTRRGQAVARQLLTEIVQARWQDPEGGLVGGLDAGEAGSSRALFDDVDDYHKWSESPLQTRTGAVLAGYRGWRREVAVETVVNAAPPITRKQVTVTATSPDGRRYELVAWRAAESGFDVQPNVQTKYVTWIGVQLQSRDGSVVDSGSAIVNMASAP